MASTIAELAALERKLMAELAAVRVEISQRAGQADPAPGPKPKPGKPAADK